MYLWIPEKDLETDLHSPCQVVADYKIRDGLLMAGHLFRSHDFGGAYPQNVYGLAQLQKQIADEVGVEPGSITTMSRSAHFYVSHR
jgi:thymidylate synthase